MKRSIPGRALHAVFGRINERRQWYELPTSAEACSTCCRCGSTCAT